MTLASDTPASDSLHPATLARVIDVHRREIGDSPSQFSREYSRLFGAPPKRDIALLRGQAEGVGPTPACN